MKKIIVENIKRYEYEIDLPKEVIVTDPGYETYIWCNTHLNIKEGKYNAVVERFDFKDGWGERNYILKLNHISCPKKKATTYESTLGVDSGQMSIFPLDYYMRKQEKEINEEWYNKVCDITLAKKACGIMDKVGIVTESGCGDGGYELKVGKNSKGEITAMEIRFF